jgi:hypothetical protein
MFSWVPTPKNRQWTLHLGSHTTMKAALLNFAAPKTQLQNRFEKLQTGVFCVGKTFLEKRYSLVH